MGFSWDGADEAKMQATFGAGRKLFSRFLDLQQVGWSLSRLWGVVAPLRVGCGL